MSEKALLLDGQVVEYEPTMIGEGAMKEVYFTKDRSSVVCFFKNTQDNYRLARLESVLGRFNPLSGTHGSYWQDYFCWVTGIVKSPRLGVVAPAYPRNYFFQSGPFQGKEKEGTWFFGRKTRPLLPKQELGSWLNYFLICIRLARAIRRLHAAGLAHSDLSPKNVLIDPTSGRCTVIDIDSLVVPGIFPPDVLGTRNYMAPEVIGSCCLPLDDPNRKTPSIRTDLHALATLIYQYLFLRHPLQGPKVHPAQSAEEQETLEMGPKALFVEHPTDRSNRPRKLAVAYPVLGPFLGELFLKAFVTGLNSPDERPTAQEWEKALYKTWDLLVPCPGARCSHGWIVLHDPAMRKCPVCGEKLTGAMPVLGLRSESRPGQWVADGELAVYADGQRAQCLYGWHVTRGAPRAEGADATRLGYFAFQNGKWLLVNEKLTSLKSPSGNHVPQGSAVELKDGAQFVLSTESQGRLAQVRMMRF